MEFKKIYNLGLSKLNFPKTYKKKKLSLKKTLFSLFQTSLLFSAFVLQAPESSFFDFSLNQSFSPKLTSLSDFSTESINSSPEILKRVFSFSNKKSLLNFKINFLTFNTAYSNEAEEVKNNLSCQIDDNIDVKMDKINHELNQETETDNKRKYDLGGFSKSFSDFLIESKDNCNDLKKRDEKCTEAKEAFSETNGDYHESCSEFGKNTNCEEFIKGCSACGSSEDDKKTYDCVKIYNKTKCPELSGPELKEAKELIEESEEEQEELKEDIQELQKDLLEKEGELNRELVEMEEEFNSSVAEFKRETENTKEELDSALIEARQAISQGLNEQIAEVQKMIDNTLATSHAFENALTKARRDYDLAVQKIRSECRAEASARLWDYRKRRRMAIENGSYRIDFSNLTSRKRVNFQEQDQRAFKNYNNSCLRARKQDLKNVELLYKDTLRGIEQKKLEFEDRINKMKARISALAQQASSQEKSLIQQYTKQMSQNTKQFEQSYKSSLQNYDRKKQSLIFRESKAIENIRSSIALKLKELSVIEQSLAEQRGLIAYMKSKGVSSEEDKIDSYSNLVRNFTLYKDAREKNWDACDCEDNYRKSACPPKTSEEKSRERRNRKRNNSGRR